MALIFAVGAAAPVRAELSGTTPSPLTVKVGSFMLGDDTAGNAYGVTSKFSGGVEYQLKRPSLGSRSFTSAYLDFSYGSGPGGSASMYSIGLAHRLSLGRPTRGGAFPYIGAGIGANVNMFNNGDSTTFPSAGELSQASFAQKIFAGLQRGDGIFYELYFRAAPQNANIITSGIGVSFGYHM